MVMIQGLCFVGRSCVFGFYEVSCGDPFSCSHVSASGYAVAGFDVLSSSHESVSGYDQDGLYELHCPCVFSTFLVFVLTRYDSGLGSRATSLQGGFPQVDGSIRGVFYGYLIW